MATKKTTDFGFQTVSMQEKAERVAQVFSSVANRYDLMNDVMSLGVHRLWKRQAIALCAIKPGHRVLDLAGGTGDLTSHLAKKVKSHGEVVLADYNREMIGVGRSRLIDDGVIDNVYFAQSDAQALSFPDNYFDCVTIAFGLRNVPDKEKALREMHRVTKLGGRLIVLEFSKPTTPWLQWLYDQYSFQLLPRLGQLIAGDRASYQYLVESIRMHPDQNTLKQMIEVSDWQACEYYNMTGGIVAIHRAFKW